ncbi:MAG: hypothetical protein R2720_14355 [Candidatus Nanopelagicales bacterium]
MISTSDLIAAGATTSEVRSLTASLERLRPGVYVPKGTDPRDVYRMRCEAVLNSLGSGAMLTGPAAAAVLELPIPGRPPTTVAVRGIPRGEYGSDVLVVHGDTDGFECKGLRLSHPAVVAADCARLMSARDALIVSDALTHEGICTVAELRDNAARSARTRGAARVRWQSDHTDPRAESPGETWTRLVLGQLGYECASQARVVDGEFSARLDFLLIDGRTAVEFDGAIKYRNPNGEAVMSAVMGEKERQALLEALGHIFVRVIWKQLTNPEMIDRRLRFAGAAPTRKPLRLPAGWESRPR